MLKRAQFMMFVLKIYSQNTGCNAKNESCCYVHSNYKESTCNKKSLRGKYVTT